jgi:hypothetical protein
MHYRKTVTVTHNRLDFDVTVSVYNMDEIEPLCIHLHGIEVDSILNDETLDYLYDRAIEIIQWETPPHDRD